MDARGIHDIVISNGRVIDPETGLDAVRNVGVSKGVIESIEVEKLNGRSTIDAGGLVVAPGFIDLHSHGHDKESYEIQALDGVTTTLELEYGAADVDKWYAEREGVAPINFGASAGHIMVRIEVMRDPREFFPVGDVAHRAASAAEIESILSRIELGLQRGGVAVGIVLSDTPAATRWEVLEVFRLAARYNAPCHVHMRGTGPLEPLSSVEGLQELIAAASITGAPLQVVHIHSSGRLATPQLLQMIGEARSRGMDVTTECYPFAAGMSGIESAMFDEGWQRSMGIDVEDLEWPETGERLTPASFAQYRETGGWVIMHGTPESAVHDAVTSPLTMIASDGFIRNGKGHPRTSGCYSRVLGRYVREERALSLMDALRKMTVMPAQRLEHRVPSMRSKGRLRVGADADLVVFDPERIMDMATFREPTVPPVGIRHVLVNGFPVVTDGRLQGGVYPGRAVRAPVS